MNVLVSTAYQAAANALVLLNSSSAWLVLSFLLAGLLHNLLSPDRMQRMLGNTRVSSLWKAIASGLLLPICSCGVIPLGLGLYFSGAYLGPTLAFMTSCPIINPAAVIMAFGLLGPQLAACYLVTGLVAAFLIGLLGNALAGPELYAPGLETPVELEPLENAEPISLSARLLAGLQWGFADLGVQVSKYVVAGILLAGLITAVVPASLIQHYLGNPGLISIGAIAVIGFVMYVCAVGHIPFIAALVASGAAPGVAVTFLMTGAATNLPELISIHNLIGRRAAIIYNVVVVGISLIAGYITNRILMPGFIPYFNPFHIKQTITIAGGLTITFPAPIRFVCSITVLLLCLYALWPGLKRLARKTVLLALALLLILTAGCSNSAPVKSGADNPPAPPAASDTTMPIPAVVYWQHNYTQYQLVTWAPGFLNGDGEEDAVIIYKAGPDKYQMVAVLNLPAGFQVTEPVPAPVSDQKLSIRDAGDKPPNEIIVSGQKNGVYGYAIYTLDKNQLLNIYSTGMDQCC
jgi:uncharacterized membrane protein YraQ (UPF0718 family)